MRNNRVLSENETYLKEQKIAGGSRTLYDYLQKDMLSFPVEGLQIFINSCNRNILQSEEVLSNPYHAPEQFSFHTQRIKNNELMRDAAQEELRERGKGKEVDNPLDKEVRRTSIDMKTSGKVSEKDTSKELGTEKKGPEKVA